jgi:flagellar basal body rod protein FlgG
MIEAMREFEAYQKAIHMFDEAASKVNNELGRL